MTFLNIFLASGSLFTHESFDAQQMAIVSNLIDERFRVFLRFNWQSLFRNEALRYMFMRHSIILTIHEDFRKYMMTSTMFD